MGMSLSQKRLRAFAKTQGSITFEYRRVIPVRMDTSKDSTEHIGKMCLTHTYLKISSK